jgi:tetratricopeptide (TPR) repeat protein
LNSPQTPPKRPILLTAVTIGLIGIAILYVGSALLHWADAPDNPSGLNPDLLLPLTIDVSSTHGDLTYVGVGACRDCHEQEYGRWQGSHHDLAMMVADEQSVIGDFSDVTFEQHGITSRFFRKGGDFYVNTEGPDGQLHDYRVRFTFGIEPLQQYLIEFPGGRLQTLPLCWDARPAAEGGQRWYHIYGDERIEPGDELFWTGPAQNWNFACAECHSTNLRKNYDYQADQYHTSFSEINVACEACHGPGSGHLDWAEQNNVADDPPNTRYDPADAKGLVVRLRDLSGGRWEYREDIRNYARTKPLDSRVMLDTCARCHSRRSVLTEDYVHGASIHDSHRVSTLDPPLYEVDGTIRDEVYVVGSFVQSKMYHAGVRCVDCHDPHSLKLHRPGNQLCTHCHQLRYDAPEHHFHPAGGEGTQCIECHMPERTYMGVDRRSGHSFSIPRPDLSVKYGNPNTCNDCHTDQSFAWSQEYVEQWYGKKPNRRPGYADALQAAMIGHPDAQRLLPEFLSDPNHPAIRRATLLKFSSTAMSTVLEGVIVACLRDEDPMVRSAAITASDAFPPQMAWELVSPLFRDPVRLVRVDAARRLAALAQQAPPGTPGLEGFEQAWSEYKHQIDIDRDRAAPIVNFATVLTQRGESAAAISELQRALEIEPWYVPGSINLADLYRQSNRNADALEVVQTALQHNPDSAILHFVLGLAQVRQRQTDDALNSLKLAAKLDPDDPQFTYTYAVALHSTLKVDQAIAVLTAGLSRRPFDRSMRLALALFHRDRGEIDQALEQARELGQWYPNDREVQGLIAELSSNTN